MYYITPSTYREPTTMLTAILESEEMSDETREELEMELERREDEMSDPVYLADLEQEQNELDADILQYEIDRCW